MAEYWAVVGDVVDSTTDPTHSGGPFKTPTNRKVKIAGIAVILVDDAADQDSKCPTDGGLHCAPIASTGSSKVKVGGKAAHRNGDLRNCGAKTKAALQTKVKIG